MTWRLSLFRWLLLVLGWITISNPVSGPTVSETAVPSPDRVRVMLVFDEVGEEGIQAVENTLARRFEAQGYSVLDHNLVDQTLRHESDVLQLYEIEAAKVLGSRLGAQIVIRGKSRTRVREKSYSSLEGKKIIVSQANVSAKAILVGTGKVVAAESAYARKPFDTTGDLALEMAAEALADKLLKGIEQFRNRPTVDYRLIILHINHPQSVALQQALRGQVEAVHELGFVKNTLELEVRVHKTQDLAFKQNMSAGFPGLGVGRLVVVAREGKTVYLQRTGDAKGAMYVPPPTPEKEVVPLGDQRAREPEVPPLDRTPSQPTGPIYKPGYGKSWAVVIGINDYQKWPKLAYAVKDAEAILKRLKKMDFDEVIPIFDAEATQRHILRVLGDELYAKTEPEDRVFIFYAGHGQTQDLPNGSKVGYIIPVDGDRTNYYSTAISMRELQDLSDRLKAKHIFYAMDSCFSGLLLRLRGEAASEYAFQAHTTARVRQVLTAGGEGEEVVEVGGHGLFTKVLLEGLDGGADLNRDDHITANELYQFITPRVLRESQNTQNPVFGRLGQGRGEFVFLQKP